MTLLGDELLINVSARQVDPNDYCVCFRIVFT